jgi:uncharacterized protein (UPF0548 family)
MWFLTRPSAARVAEVLESARRADFNYEVRGAFFRNETDILLGRGEDCWLTAVGRFRGWNFVHLGWCDFLSVAGEPEKGDVLAARVKHLGFWSLNPSRIIAVERETRRIGFTIRTLAGHAECGEEQIRVEWLPSGEVRFTIRSYSRPATIAGWLALPYVRHLQRRFGREVAHFMQTGYRQ